MMVTDIVGGLRFDHIGVVVRELGRGRSHLGALFGIAEWTREFEDPTYQVYVQFGRDGSGVCYEIIAPLGAESPVALALRKGNRILNHVAYLVADLEAAAERVQRQGCVPAGEAKPAVAYGGRRIQFFLSPLRFIFELIEAPDHRHSYSTLP